ncbi:MAG: cytidine deaminase [Mycoplasmoidaceae bacterium]
MTNKFTELKKIINNSYCPYSNLKVGAIVVPLSNKRECFFGVNVENASFGATICAERTAICSMISNGHKIISEIHLFSSTKNESLFPCGLCRQFISEFANSDTEIYVYNRNGRVVIKKFTEIMPFQIFKNKDIS